MLSRKTTSQKSASGLTLLEVMVALGVMVILVGGIFLVVQTSLRTVLFIDEKASREDEITNTIDILRAAFSSLPDITRLTAEPAILRGNPGFLVAMRDAPNVLSWLPADDPPDMVVLLGVMQEEDGWQVAIKRFRPGSNLSATETRPEVLLRAGADVAWLPLVGGFQEIRVQFFDKLAENWVTNWSREDVRPSLMEFRIFGPDSDGTGGGAPVFWLPSVQVRGATR